MPLFKKKEILSKEDQTKVVSAIKQAEIQTSGEVRVFIESKCRYVDAIDRAIEIFFNLKMDKTQLRNGVIVYVAVQHRQSAIFGDSGIFEVTGGPAYWKRILCEMNNLLREDKLADGLSHAINRIGDDLARHFPYDAKTDKNELPDDIIFGS